MSAEFNAGIEAAAKVAESMDRMRGGSTRDGRYKEYSANVQQAIRALSKPAAPEPLSPSPEIRYQLRNWHHVTCAGFGGQACTCLAQREALIAELAKGEL